MASISSTLRLKEVRKRSGLTQKEVAGMLGISQNNYSYFENGKVKIADCYLFKLAEIFNCSADYILGIKDAPTPGEKRIDDETILRMARKETTIQELEMINLIQSDESRWEYYKTLKSQEEQMYFVTLCLHTSKELAERKKTLEMSLQLFDDMPF